MPGNGPKQKVTRRNLKGIGSSLVKTKKKSVPKRWELREASGAGIIHISWNFTNSKEIPFNLKKREWNPVQYTARRIQEVFAGKANPGNITTQRNGISDSGIHLPELKLCQGGAELLNNLISEGWIITDAWWENRESEESKAQGRGHVKARVHLVLSREGEEKIVKEITMKGLRRLAYMTWICHIWDNTKVNNGVTVNFTVMQKNTSPKKMIVLPKA